MANQPINVTYDFRSGAVTNRTAENGNDLVNKSQIESMIAGNIAAKASVSVATYDNVDLTTGGLLTIDTYAVQEGDRVLAISQLDATENGIYIASSGTWVRASDADETAELKPFTYTYVLEGEHKGRKFQLINSVAPVVGTDPQLWDAVPVPANEAVNTTVDSSGLTLYSSTNLQEAMERTDSLVHILNNSVGITELRLSDVVGSAGGDLGAFTGTLIPDSVSVKDALQSVETALESFGNQVNTAKYVSPTNIGVPNGLWTVVQHNLNTQFPSSVQFFDSEDNYTHITHGFRWRPKEGSTTDIEIFQDSGVNRAIKVVAHR